jgi:hypothetical protein
MKNNIVVYRGDKNSAEINQVSIKREWMDQTDNKHAYQCMPVSLANTLGWAISFPEDISFIWDGICDTSDTHIKIIKGHKYCSTARANATVSFNTYLTFKTSENITTLVMPVPNQFNENAQCFTTLITTSFYKSMIPIAWKVLKPNIEINIPAGQPVAVIIPISLTELQNFEVNIENGSILEKFQNEIQENLQYVKEKSKIGKFTHLYRKAKNSKGESVGNHEVQTLELKTNRRY